MNKPWVLADTSYLAYRAMHSVGYLSFEDIPTGVIFGFLTQLRALCEDSRINSNRVLLFFDSFKSKRRDAYPEYKAKRRKQREEDGEERERVSYMFEQVHLLRDKILPAMGFPCYSQEGLESDDLMADVSYQLQGAGEKGVIITADSDLFQCIHENCHWYDPARKYYYEPASFEEKYGLPPSRWGEVKALAGCSTDNVAGVPGVGDKTAVKYLRGHLSAKSKAYGRIESEEGKAIKKRNEALVVLPHLETDEVHVREPELKSDVLMAVAERYGMVSILKGRTGWKLFLEGQKLRRRAT
jgi:DNA polymerase-1